MSLLFLLAAQVAVTTPPVQRWEVRPIAGGEMRYIQPVPRDRDYPRAALNAGIQGTTIVQLIVSPAGAIMSCETVQSAGSPDLDRQACEMYRQRGRFEFTGIDRPVTLRAPVTWQLGDHAPPVPSPEVK